MTALMRTVGQSARLVRDVLFPRACAGCGCPDAVLCGSCEALLGQPVGFALPGSDAGRGAACGWYRGRLRQAVLSWKDHGDCECDVPFCRAMGNLLDEGAMAWLSSSYRHVLVMPVPSGARSVRHRGRRQCAPLAEGVVRVLRSYGIDASFRDALAVRGARRKSVQVSSAGQRASRLEGRLAFDGRGIATDGTVGVLLVDDIVTTGSTLRACTDLLARSGMRVATALALAYTPRKGGMASASAVAV